MRESKLFWVSMKQRIIDALKTRYRNLGLGDKAFGGVAAFIEKTVAKEEDIEAAVAGDDVAALLRAIQGETDSLRGSNAELQRSLDELRGKGGNSGESKPGETESGQSETLAALKALGERFGKLEEEYSKAKARERNSGITAEIRRRLEAKGSGCAPVLDLVLGNLSIGESDTADTLADKCAASYDETYRRFYGDGPVPPAGGRAGGGYKKGDFSAEVERLRAEGKIPQKQ